MPRKEMTPEEKKAFGEKMKAARAAKKQIAENVGDNGLEELKRQVEELKQQLSQGQAPKETAQISDKGKLVGTVERYVVDPDYYPDPRERLAGEARLQRFAFPLNYELNWEIMPTRYQTIDGVWMREPRFVLTLLRILMDENGEPTNQRAVVSRLTFHEDPDAAMVIAQEQGLNVDQFGGEKVFLDEMRYLRARDWLLECFYAPKPSTHRKLTEKVIGNKLVQIIEIASESSETIPFSQLSQKL